MARILYGMAAPWKKRPLKIHPSLYAITNEPQPRMHLIFNMSEQRQRRPPPEPGYFNQLCKYFQKRYCEKGEGCPSNHSQDNQRPHGIFSRIPTGAAGISLIQCEGALKPTAQQRPRSNNTSKHNYPKCRYVGEVTPTGINRPIIYLTTY